MTQQNAPARIMIPPTMKYAPQTRPVMMNTPRKKAMTTSTTAVATKKRGEEPEHDGAAGGLGRDHRAVADEPDDLLDGVGGLGRPVFAHVWSPERRSPAA